MSRLKERAIQLQSNLEIMENREKGDMKRIVGMDCTITDFGFLKDEKDKEYVCFIIKEDTQKFYFGGQVLTEQLQILENEGYKGDVIKEGLPVHFSAKMSKNKREYTAVEFYPEPITPTK